MPENEKDVKDAIIYKLFRYNTICEDAIAYIDNALASIEAELAKTTDQEHINMLNNEKTTFTNEKNNALILDEHTIFRNYFHSLQTDYINRSQEQNFITFGVDAYRSSPVAEVDKLIFDHQTAMLKKDADKEKHEECIKTLKLNKINFIVSHGRVRLNDIIEHFDAMISSIPEDFPDFDPENIKNANKNDIIQAQTELDKLYVEGETTELPDDLFLMISKLCFATHILNVIDDNSLDVYFTLMNEEYCKMKIDFYKCAQEQCTDLERRKQLAKDMHVYVSFTSHDKVDKCIDQFYKELLAAPKEDSQDIEEKGKLLHKLKGVLQDNVDLNLMQQICISSKEEIVELASLFA